MKTLEGDDVEVTSCEKRGEAITRDSEYGVSLNEAWKCAVSPRNGAGRVESCYAVYNDIELGVIGRLNCSSLEQKCPPGGRRVRGKVFLGPIIHPDLVYGRALGKAPPHQTVRVDVSHDASGAQEHCGYLDVQVPIGAEDAVQSAAERVEAHGWSEARYSFSSRALDD